MLNSSVIDASWNIYLWWRKETFFSSIASNQLVGVQKINITPELFVELIV
jgi:hypothetical protein